MNALFTAALSGLILLTFTGFFGGYNLFLDLTSHFRLQYYLIASALMIIFVLMRKWRWTLLSLIPVAVNGFFIFSWFIAPPVQMQTTPDLRILICNVEKYNKHYDSVIKTVEESGADVAVLVETDFEWTKNLDTLKQNYPYQMIRGRDDCLGMSVFSRFPLEAEQLRLHKDNEVYSHTMKITADGKAFTLIAVHVQLPVLFWHFAHRSAGYQEVIEQVKSHPSPIVVAGDFNTAMWSPYYRKIIRETGLQNTRQGFGVMQTWPTFFPAWMRIPLDYCLVSPGIQVAGIRTGNQTGSDHLPLIVDLKL